MKLAKNDFEYYVCENKDVNDRCALACRAVMNDYCSTKTNIEDAINETCDSLVPVYSWELRAATPTIAEHVESAVADGLVELNIRDFSLDSLLSVGYYEFLESHIQENLSAILFQIAVQAIESLGDIYISRVTELTGEKDEAFMQGLDDIIEDYQNNQDKLIRDLFDDVRGFCVQSFFFEQE